MDSLTKLAIEAVAKARETHPDGPVRIVAIKYLREVTGLGIPECQPAVVAAMEQPPAAADLADGSIVVDANHAYIKNHPTKTAQWRGTNGGYFHDSLIDDILRDGATVLRIGI